MDETHLSVLLHFARAQNDGAWLHWMPNGATMFNLLAGIGAQLWGVETREWSAHNDTLAYTRDAIVAQLPSSVRSIANEDAITDESVVRLCATLYPDYHEQYGREHVLLAWRMPARHSIASGMFSPFFVALVAPCIHIAALAAAAVRAAAWVPIAYAPRLDSLWCGCTDVLLSRVTLDAARILSRGGLGDVCAALASPMRAALEHARELAIAGPDSNFAAGVTARAAAAAAVDIASGADDWRADYPALHDVGAELLRMYPADARAPAALHVRALALLLANQIPNVFAGAWLVPLAALGAGPRFYASCAARRDAQRPRARVHLA